MLSWSDMEAHATDNGFIPCPVYTENAGRFRVCPPPDRERAETESEIWRTYLSATRKKTPDRNLYTEMYRYEWYEGRKRKGFWGNIEDAVKSIRSLENPRICIFQPEAEEISSKSASPPGCSVRRLLRTSKGPTGKSTWITSPWPNREPGSS